MKTFQLSRFALDDVREILSNRARLFGVEAADQLQDEFLVALSALAATPGLGHTRQDLTARPYFFYTLEPYLIVYVRDEDSLPILAILHAARDIQRVLRRRFPETSISRRAAGASSKTLGELLDTAPNRAPDPGDEL